MYFRNTLLVLTLMPVAVLAAEQELIEIQGARVQSRTEQTLAMVNLYRAMAGPPGGFTPVSALPYNRPRG